MVIKYLVPVINPYSVSLIVVCFPDQIPTDIVPISLKIPEETLEKKNEGHD